METMREKLAQVIYATYEDGLHGVAKIDVCNIAIRQLLTLFREAIEKLKPLSDEEILKAMEKAHKPCSMEFKDEPKIKAVAQAAVEDIKRQLFEILEGK